MRASRGLKWENKMYKPKRSIKDIFSPVCDYAGNVDLNKSY